MGPIDDAKTIAEAGGTALTGTSKLMDSLLKILPGLAVASEARGVARANTIMLDAIDETITRCRKMGLPQETTDAMCVLVANEFGRAENLSSCLSFARDATGDSCDTSNIDHSWFLKWSDCASEQSDDEMRVIWGNLLAGELEQSGSYSKRTMSVLADMSLDDANAFSELCSTCVYTCAGNTVSTERPHIILVEDKTGQTFNNGLFNYSKRSQLESLGVIDSSIRSFFTLHPGESNSFVVGDRLVTARNDTDSDKEFSASPVLTKTGLELSRLCEIGSCRNLAEYLTKTAMNCELTVYSDLRTYEIAKK